MFYIIIARLKVMLVLICGIFAVTNGCVPQSDNAGGKDNANSNLNISIFLDLSDRLDTLKYPSAPQHYRLDIGNIKYIYGLFEQHVVSKKIIFIDDQIRVYFDPVPKIQSIGEINRSLAISLSNKNPQEIKAIIESDAFCSSVDSIYGSVVRNTGHSDKFQGSNIWRFFKDEVKDRCVKRSDKYRNILVIFTDGYMYWPSDKRVNGNEYNYIEREYWHFKRFRDSDSLRDFDKDGYGFISTRDDLSDLEVLVVDVSPEKLYPQDYDILSKYWIGWLKKMNINKYKIIKSDLPANMEQEIKAFIVDK